MFKSNMFKKERIVYINISYAVYLLVSLAATIWVAATLKRNGRIFLVHAFGGDPGLADSINHLLVVGFYLVNVGYVTLALRTDAMVENTRQAIEIVCAKIGVVLLVLGFMHFANLYVFNKLRKRANPGPRIGIDRLPSASWESGKVLD